MSESTCISVGGVGNSVAGVGHQLLGWYLYTTLAVSYPTLALSYPTLALIDTSLKGSRVRVRVSKIGEIPPDLPTNTYNRPVAQAIRSLEIKP
jgi:hypothetical protein